MVTRDAVFYAGLKSVKRQLAAHGVRKLFFAGNWKTPPGTRWLLMADPNQKTRTVSSLD